MKNRSSLFEALLIGALVFVVHSVSPMLQSGDSRWTVPAMEHLLKHGDVQLDEYVTRWTPDGLYTIDCVGPGGEVRKAQMGGCGELFHAYPRYPVATLALGFPLFVVADRLAPLTPGLTPRLAQLARREYREAYGILEMWMAAAVVALCAVFVFLSIPVRGAAWLWTLAFGFGTSAWSTASRAMWSHGMSMLFLAAALYFLTAKRQRVFLAGVLLGVACWNRPLDGIALLCLAVWLRGNGWRLLAGAAAASVPFAVYCLAVYRMPVQPYFLVSKQYVWDVGRAAGVLVGQLISPGRGLLVYSPFLLLLPLGAWLWWKRDRGLVVALLVWFTVHAAAISFFGDWTAGTCYGPRYWCDILPGMILLVSAVWPVKKWMYALVVLAVLIHAQGAMNVRTQEWNARWLAGKTTVWEWKEAPFLAGIAW